MPSTDLKCLSLSEATAKQNSLAAGCVFFIILHNVYLIDLKHPNHSLVGLIDVPK